MKRLVIGFCIASSVGAALAAQNAARPADGDWPLYSRDLAGTKDSPLAQITSETWQG